MNITCPHCGAGIDDEGRFCKYCGNKLPENKETIVIEQTVNQNIRNENVDYGRIKEAEARIKEAESKRKTTKYIIIFLAALVYVIILMINSYR